MNLSRKWLSEFVSVEADDKEFAESMTLSGSKVELTHDLGAEISERGGGQGAVHGAPPGQRPHVGVPDRRGPGGAGADRHRGLERPHRRPGACGHAQVHPARGQEDRKGQAAGRGVQRHAVRPE